MPQREQSKMMDNPTILHYRNFDKFWSCYNSDTGRPETQFVDLSASHTAQSLFRARELSGEYDIYSYQYQIKQWAYDNQFESLVFDDYKRIAIKPYWEIDEKDFDPIEIYAYLVGLNVVNMHSEEICTNYLLSYPPSYSMEVCERIRKSFEKGIRKAIPTAAQKEPEFENYFSVQLGQSEPAAYAVCALKEYGIAKKYEAKPVLCGVYDLGGGTVDYHFGIFSGGKPPYCYKGIRSGGNPRLGCENILEELAYDVFTYVKEELSNCGIKYEFPHQYSKTLQDKRYTSNSRQARLNTLGMIDELRKLWVHNFESKEDSLCYFKVYPEEDSNEMLSATKKGVQPDYYIEVIKASANSSKKFYSSSETTEPLTHDESNESFSEEQKGALPSVEMKIYIKLERLVQFFRERLENTIREFLGMMWQTIQENDLSALKMENVIFLAGNGSKAPMVFDIFNKCIKEQKYWQDQCELYPPLSTEKAEEYGQKIQNRKGSIPTAKTGVAHGLLLSRPGSDFIRIEEFRHAFVFKYHLGLSRYDPDLDESIFCCVRKADSFLQSDKKDSYLREEDSEPFAIGKDGYLQFWYTSSLMIYEQTTLDSCNARQFLMKIPEDKLSKEAHEDRRGECYCRAITETVMELLVHAIDTDQIHCYGTLDLETGRFQKY